MRKGGFSFVEFLIATAIILVLAAVLIPALQRGRIQSRMERKIIAKLETGQNLDQEDITFLETSPRIPPTQNPSKALGIKKEPGVRLTIIFLDRTQQTEHTPWAQAEFWFVSQDDYRINQAERTILIKRGLLFHHGLPLVVVDKTISFSAFYTK